MGAYLNITNNASCNQRGIDQHLGNVAWTSFIGNSGRGEPWLTWIAILVASGVLISSWIKYLNRDPETEVPLRNLFWVSAVCSAIIIVSVFDLLHT